MLERLRLKIWMRHQSHIVTLSWFMLTVLRDNNNVQSHPNIQFHSILLLLILIIITFVKCQVLIKKIFISCIFSSVFNGERMSKITYAQIVPYSLKNLSGVIPCQEVFLYGRNHAIKYSGYVLRRLPLTAWK